MRTFFLLLVVLASGCASNRVNLGPVPDRSAPLAERVRAFKRLSIRSGERVTWLKNGVPVSTSTQFVMLGDGTRVEDARDLAPLVDAHSPAGRYISAVETSTSGAQTAMKVLGIGGGLSIALGLGIGLPLMLQPQTCDRFTCRASDTNMTGIIITSVLAGLGYLALQSMLFVAGPASGRGPDRDSAFLTYNDSLQQRLGLDEESLEQERAPLLPPPSARLLPDSLRLVSARR